MTEHLSYIRLEETEFDYEIVMQFDAGGALLEINKKDNSSAIIYKLREFAYLLEESITQRIKEAEAKRVIDT